jgi:transposase
MNAALFEEWVENVSFPPSRQAISSSWTICLAHKGARIEQPINAATELRYLPPYSPDMNPIEKAFSKLKALSCASSPSEASPA